MTKKSIIAILLVVLAIPVLWFVNQTIALRKHSSHNVTLGITHEEMQEYRRRNIERSQEE